MSNLTSVSEKKNGTDLLQVRNLKKYFPVKTGVLQRVSDHVLAVDDVSFSVRNG
jgi:peptide/nickel transport system ATP-binding protein/oligopeptide transport system ATP-binding protein